MRPIGLHVRLDNGLASVTERVQLHTLTALQSFLIDQRTQKYIEPTVQEAASFKAATAHIPYRFVHASYWTNLAQMRPTSVRWIQQEIAQAKRLGFTHMIFHAGYAKGAQNRIEGIDALARRLNFILRYEQELTIVLENTAHAGLSIGGDFADFKSIADRLEHPEKLFYCLDTAHAHVYGYDLHSWWGQQTLLASIDNSIGLDRIVAIHLNNTNKACGSYLDEHVLLDEGSITIAALRTLVQHEPFTHIPLIMEMPIASVADERKQLDLLRSW